MNKVLCLMLVLLCAAGIFAQEKTINESEFTTIYKNARAQRENKSYRTKTTFQNIVEGKPERTNSGTVIMEFTPPATSRIVFQSKSDPQVIERERIKVNDKTYMRQGGAAWQQDSSNGRQNTNSNPVVESKSEYKFIGSEMMNNQNASVYEKIERRKRISQKDNKEITSDIMTKFWFGKNEELLKIERTADVRIGDEVLHNSLTRTYEFDPAIKIETPQIVGSEKQ